MSHAIVSLGNLHIDMDNPSNPVDSQVSESTSTIPSHSHESSVLKLQILVFL